MKVDLTSLSDERLMEMFQSGSYPAYEVLFQRHSSRVVTYLAKKTSLSQAQDLTQEVFLKLLKTKNQYNSKYPFLPWLFTITRNLLLDEYKKAESKISSRSVNDEVLNQMPAHQESSQENPTYDLTEALKQLPPNQQEAIKLRYLQDWSFEEISTKLSTTEANVRQLISRGLKKLKGGS